MTTLESLYIDLKFNTKSIKNEIKDLEKVINSQVGFEILPKIKISQSILKDVERILSAKTGSFDLEISPKVDTTELHALNDLLDIKKQHYKEVRDYILKNPLSFVTGSRGTMVTVGGSPVQPVIDAIESLKPLIKDLQQGGFLANIVEGAQEALGVRASTKAQALGIRQAKRIIDPNAAAIEEGAEIYEKEQKRIQDTAKSQLVFAAQYADSMAAYQQVLREVADKGDTIKKALVGFSEALTTAQEESSKRLRIPEFTQARDLAAADVSAAAKGEGILTLQEAKSSYELAEGNLAIAVEQQIRELSTLRTQYNEAKTIADQLASERQMARDDITKSIQQLSRSGIIGEDFDVDQALRKQGTLEAIQSRALSAAQQSQQKLKPSNEFKPLSVQQQAQQSVLVEQEIEKIKRLQVNALDDTKLFMAGVVKELAPLLGTETPSIKDLPSVGINKVDGALASYVAGTNTINLGQETYNKILTGATLSLKEMESVVHEVTHAFQSNFGKTGRIEQVLQGKGAGRIEDITAEGKTLEGTSIEKKAFISASGFKKQLDQSGILNQRELLITVLKDEVEAYQVAAANAAKVGQNLFNDFQATLPPKEAQKQIEAKKQPEVIEAIDVNKFKEDIKKVDALFSEKYQELKQTVNDGNLELAKTIADQITTLIPLTKDELDKQIQEIKDLIQQGFLVEKDLGPLKSDIAGAKGRLTQKENLTKKMVGKIDAQLAQKQGAEVGNAISDGLAQSLEIADPWKDGAEFGNEVIKGAKDSLGIASPSKEFIKIGKFIIDGLKQGFNQAMGKDPFVMGETMDDVRDYVGDIIDDLKKDFDQINQDALNLENLNVLGVETANQVRKEVDEVIAGIKQNINPDETINDIQGEIHDFADGVSQLRDELNAIETLGIETVQGIKKEIGEKIEIDLSLDPDATVEEIKDAYQEVIQDIETTRSQVRMATGIGPDKEEQENIQSSSEDVEELANNIGGLITGIGAAVVAFASLDNAIQGIKDSIAVSIQFEAFANTLNFAAGGAFSASQDFEFLADMSKKLGVEIKTATESYAAFASVLKGQLPKQQIRGIFESVNQAAALFGLSAAQTERAFTALQQIAAKGVVSQEELRGQLGEALPVALQASATGLNTTVKGLNEMVKAGLSATDFLPAFEKGLRQTLGSKIPETSQMKINRLGNAITELQLKVGDFLKPAFIGAVEAASKFLGVLSDNFQDLMIVLGALSFKLLLSALPLVVKGLGSLFTTLGLVTSSMRSFSAAYDVMIAKEGIMRATLAASVVGFKALGAAVAKASIAMLANPLTWVVVAIAAVVKLKNVYSDLDGVAQKALEPLDDATAKVRALQQATADILAQSKSSSQIDTEMIQNNVEELTGSLSRFEKGLYLISTLGTKSLKTATLEKNLEGISNALNENDNQLNKILATGNDITSATIASSDANEEAITVRENQIKSIESLISANNALTPTSQEEIDQIRISNSIRKNLLEQLKEEVEARKSFLYTLEGVTEARDKENEAIERESSLLEQQAGLDLSQGLSTIAEAEAKKLDIAQDAIESQIKLQEDTRRKLRIALRRAEVEQREEIKQEILNTEHAIADLKLKSEQGQVEIERQGFETRLDALDSNLQKRLDLQEKYNKKFELELTKAVQQYGLIEESAEIQRLQRQQENIDKELATRKRFLARLNVIEKQTKDPEIQSRITENIKTAEAEILTLQQERLSLNPSLVSARIAEYDAIQSERQQSNDIAVTENERVLQEQFNQGLITAKQLEEARAKQTKAGIRQNMAMQEQYLAFLLNLQGQNPFDAGLRKHIASTRKELANLGLELSQTLSPEEIIDERLEQLATKYSDTLDQLELRNKELDIELQKGINIGLISREEADALILGMATKRIAEELRLEQNRIKDLESLEKSNPSLETEAEIMAARKRTLDLTLELLNKELEAREALATKIDDMVTKEGQRIDLISRGQGLFDKLLNSQLSLLTARNELESVLSDLQEKALERQLESIHLSERENMARWQRESLEARIARAQKALSNARVANFLREQQQAQLTLDLETRRAKMESHRLEIEAKRNVLSAQGELINAQKEGDAIAFSLAQQSLALAEEELSLVSQTQQALLEENRLKQEALLATQQLAREEFQRSEIARRIEESEANSLKQREEMVSKLNSADNLTRSFGVNEAKITKEVERSLKLQTNRLGLEAVSTRNLGQQLTELRAQGQTQVVGILNGLKAIPVNEVTVQSLQSLESQVSRIAARLESLGKLGGEIIVNPTFNNTFRSGDEASLLAKIRAQTLNDITGVVAGAIGG